MDKLVRRIGSRVPLPDSHLTSMQAAKEAGVTRQGLIQAISNGRLKATKFDRRYFILPADLKLYMSHKWRRDHTKDEAGNLVYDPTKGTYSIRQAVKYMREHLGDRFKANRLYNLIKRDLLPYAKYGCAYVLSQETLDELVIFEKARKIRS